MESTLNLENIKGIYQENCFVYHIQNYFSNYVYLKDIYIYQTLKGIRKIQFVSELTLLLNLYISKFHKEKNWTPYMGRLTLV